jgi:micrococcal nuclease
MQMKFKISKGSFLFLFALLIGIITSIPSLKQPPQQDVGKVLSTTNKEPVKQNVQEALVVSVVDGDTIKVSYDGLKKTIRLIGIDSPESVHPYKPIECFGKEASNKLKEILMNKMVYLHSDDTQGDQDKYGRLLRYVFLAYGTDINALMVQQGYAYEYTYDDPYYYQSIYKKAQIDAETNKRGLWADNACIH